MENLFGILVSKFQIFKKPIDAHPETVDLITKCCLVLHNFCRDNVIKSHQNDPFHVDERANELPDEYRHALPAIHTKAAGRLSDQAVFYRNKMAEFFISSSGKLSWQDEYIDINSKSNP